MQTFFKCVLGIALSAALAPHADAQTYPDKPIRVVVPFAVKANPGKTSYAFGNSTGQVQRRLLRQRREARFAAGALQEHAPGDDRLDGRARPIHVR